MDALFGYQTIGTVIDLNRPDAYYIELFKRKSYESNPDESLEG